MHATAAGDRDSAFVRVLLLPEEWTGKRTIRYVDPADDEKPRLQRPDGLLRPADHASLTRERPPRGSLPQSDHPNDTRSTRGQVVRQHCDQRVPR